MAGPPWLGVRLPASRNFSSLAIFAPVRPGRQYFSDIHYAKSSAGWSAYINGMQVDFELFQREIRQVCEHVRATTPK